MNMVVWGMVYWVYHVTGQNWIPLCNLQYAYVWWTYNVIRIDHWFFGYTIVWVKRVISSSSIVGSVCWRVQILMLKAHDVLYWFLVNDLSKWHIWLGTTRNPYLFLNNLASAGLSSLFPIKINTKTTSLGNISVWFHPAFLDSPSIFPYFFWYFGPTPLVPGELLRMLPPLAGCLVRSPGRPHGWKWRTADETAAGDVFPVFSMWEA